MKSIRTKITKALYFSLVAFSLIGITQFLSGSNIGWPFNLLGERTFNTNSIGISLVSVFGKSMLRAYSTFSHPNSLAGFYLLSGVLILALDKSLVYMKRNVLLNLLIVLVFVLTFSKSAFVSLLLILIAVWVSRKKEKINFSKVVKLTPILLFLLSLMMMTGVFNGGGLFEYGKNISERFELIGISRSLLYDNLFVGVGANNFIPQMVNARSASRWLLQPVHNIYLLFFVEFGLLGLLTLFLSIEKILFKLIDKNNMFVLCGFMVILLTGLFDHYWITIFQNRMIAAVFFGFVLNNNLLKHSNY